MILTALAHATNAFVRTPITPSPSTKPKTPTDPEKVKLKHLTDGLNASGGMKDWVKWCLDEGRWEGCEGEDGIRKKAGVCAGVVFGSVMKAASGWEETMDPKGLLLLRLAGFVTLIPSQVPLAGSGTSSANTVDHSFDQARRALLLYARSFPSSSSYPTVANTARLYLSTLLTSLPSGYTSKGKGWVGLLELVSGLLRRGEDWESVRWVSGLLGVDDAQMPTDGETGLVKVFEKLGNALGIVERWAVKGEGDEESTILELSQTLITIRSYLHLRPLPSTTAIRRTKIDAVLDRFRRVCIRVFRKHRSDAPFSTELQDNCKAVLEAILGCWEGRLGEEGLEGVEKKQLVTGGIDTLMCLSETAFQLDDLSTYDPAFDFLSRCLPLIRFLEPPKQDVKLVGCVLSAFYNISISLYDEDRLAMASKFLGLACGFTEETLGLTRFEEEVEKGQEQATGELRLKLVKRWELLALCQVRDDKAAAHGSYIKAILTHGPVLLGGLAEKCGKEPVGVVMKTELALVKIVQRVTRLAVFDLLWEGEKCSLYGELEEAGVPKEVTGMVLEVQLSSLIPQIRKPESRSAITHLLEGAAKCFSADLFPLRRARVLCRTMEHRVSGEERSPCSPVDEGEATLHDLANEIEELCEGPRFHSDAQLTAYATQYRSFAHVWLALAAQQQGQADAFVRECKVAVEGFRKLAASLPSPTKASVVAPPSSKTKFANRISLGTGKVVVVSPLATAGAVVAKRQPVAKAKGKAPATPAAGRKRAALQSRTVTMKTPMKTPPSKTASPADGGSFRSKNGGALPHLDDSERHCQHLSMLAQVLAAQGYSTLRIAVLKVLRRFVERDNTSATATDAFLSATIELAEEYLRIGKTERTGILFAQAEARVAAANKSDCPASGPSQVQLCLAYARYQATIGNLESGLTSYREAESCFLAIDDPGRSNESSLARLMNKTKSLHVAAMAASTFSHLQAHGGSLVDAIPAALQASRLLHRAFANLSRIAGPQAPPTTGDSVFTSGTPQDGKTPLPDVAIDSRPRIFSFETHQTGEMLWQIGAMLFDVIRQIIVLYMARGSSRATEAYLHQLAQLCKQLGSSRATVRSVGIHADYGLLSGNLEAVLGHIQESIAMLDLEPSCESVDIGRLHCDLHWKRNELEPAQGFCSSTQKTIARFERLFSAHDEPTFTSHKSPRVSTSLAVASPVQLQDDSVLPSVLAHILRIKIQISLEVNKVDDVQADLRRLSKVSFTNEDQALELLLLASIKMHTVRRRLKTDPLFGLLSEAVITLPFSAPVAKGSTKTEHLADIGEGIALVKNAIVNSSNSAPAHQVRDMMYTLANLRFMQYTMGKPSSGVPAEIAAALDFGSSITIKRELMEVTGARLLPQIAPDDLRWPQQDSDSSASTRPTSRTTVTMKDYWRSVQLDHRADFSDPTTYRPIENLSAEFGVVSLHLSPDRESLFLIRHTTSETPRIFKLPLDRAARREGESDLYDYPSASAELQSIIAASNEASQRAKFLSGHDDKVTWWSERKELDDRMKDLVECIENCWLGGCKGLLRKCPPPEAAKEVKTSLEKLFRRHLLASQDRQSTRANLDDGVVASFVALQSDCRDEDLEDLLYFAIDMYQLAGAPVVCDEVDADQVVCDLREIQQQSSVTSLEEQHLFLILDKNLQSFPWESLPILQGRSVSRIPSLAFLRDRLNLPSSWSTASNDVASPSASFVVNTARTSYILNPSGDLTATQGQFEEWLEANHAKGWSGVKGRAPGSDEMRKALSSSDLMLYFGHGGGEAYIRSNTIRQLPRCAVTMLWGCSSGLLRDLGDFEPSGTPSTYMLAGCPTLLANLWDVTDKDIDRLAKDVFRRTGLEGTTDAPVSLTQALADSRAVCTMRYLNGAAPVVYGLPCRFTSQV